MFLIIFVPDFSHIYFNNWMSESLREIAFAGRIYDTIVDWVNKLQNAVDTSLIQRFFKFYGISNKRDETDDDWILNYKRLEQVKSSVEAVFFDDNGKDINDEDNEINDNEEEGDYDNEWDNQKYIRIHSKFK